MEDYTGVIPGLAPTSTRLCLSATTMPSLLWCRALASARIAFFWNASPRATLPPGKLGGCTVKARVKISPGALLPMGMDYWRNATVPCGPGGNNHEAGASN